MSFGEIGGLHSCEFWRDGGKTVIVKAIEYHTLVITCTGIMSFALLFSYYHSCAVQMKVHTKFSKVIDHYNEKKSYWDPSEKLQVRFV